MNFIKKIVDKKSDESVHLQFQKFSKGEFRNKSIISAKLSKGKYSIGTTAEFANEMIRDVAEKILDKKTLVTGSIITTINLDGELKYDTKKQFQGIKNYGISGEMTGKEIINLLNKFPKAFFGLSFKTEDTELKIKPKAPKSGKPSSKEGEEPKADFCKLTTTDKRLGSSFIFEQENFSKASVNHTYLIDNIIIPAELKASTDFALVREASRRAGRIIRKATIDEKEISQEINFDA